jgi:hypothetical protein
MAYSAAPSETVPGSTILVVDARLAYFIGRTTAVISANRQLFAGTVCTSSRAHAHRSSQLSACDRELHVFRASPLTAEEADVIRTSTTAHHD